MTTIIVTHEDNEVDEFEFGSDHASISIGRRSSNDVCVPNLSVSGNHASIVFENNSAWLEDLKSTNGTYINGVKISRHEIQDGDEIILGKIRLAFISADYDPAATHSSTLAGSESTLSSSHDLSSGLAQIAQDAQDASEPDSADGGRGTPENLSANSATADVEAENSVAPAQVAQIKTGESDEDEASFARDASLFDQTPGNGAPASDAAAPASKKPAHPLEGVERHDTSVAPMHELDSTPAASKGAVIDSS